MFRGHHVAAQPIPLGGLLALQNVKTLRYRCHAAAELVRLLLRFFECLGSRLLGRRAIRFRARLSLKSRLIRRGPVRFGTHALRVGRRSLLIRTGALLGFPIGLRTGIVGLCVGGGLAGRRRLPFLCQRLFALGADRAAVRRLVLREGMTLASAGLALGILAALALSRLLSSVLFETRAQDPLTLAAVGALLLGVALLACAIPARRAGPAGRERARTRPSATPKKPAARSQSAATGSPAQPGGLPTARPSGPSTVRTGVSSTAVRSWAVPCSFTGPFAPPPRITMIAAFSAPFAASATV